MTNQPAFPPIDFYIARVIERERAVRLAQSELATAVAALERAMLRAKNQDARRVREPFWLQPPHHGERQCCRLPTLT